VYNIIRFSNQEGYKHAKFKNKLQLAFLLHFGSEYLQRTNVNIQIYQDRPYTFRWIGHVERMQDTVIPKKMLYGKLYATRRRGRPKIRWLDDVSMDLRKLGVSGWRNRARSREAWRRVAVEAKGHPGL
jgi:hypothetical protein